MSSHFPRFLGRVRELLGAVMKIFKKPMVHAVVINMTVNVTTAKVQPITFTRFMLCPEAI